MNEEKSRKEFTDTKYGLLALHNSVKMDVFCWDAHAQWPFDKFSRQIERSGYVCLAIIPKWGKGNWRLKMTQGTIAKSNTEVELFLFMFHVNHFLSFVAQCIIQYNYYKLHSQVANGPEEQAIC